MSHERRVRHDCHQDGGLAAWRAGRAGRRPAGGWQTKYVSKIGLLFFRIAAHQARAHTAFVGTEGREEGDGTNTVSWSYITLRRAIIQPVRFFAKIRGRRRRRRRRRRGVLFPLFPPSLPRIGMRSH